MSERQAEDLFTEWLDRVVRDEKADFEAFAAAHPEHASELRRCQAEWLAVRGALSLPSESDESLLVDPNRTQVAPDIEPAVLLGPNAGGASDSALFEAIKARGPASMRYELKGEIGKGGMGAVFRVFDAELRRHLAMKVMLEGNLRHLPRFLEEAQVTGQLDHPGIVPVHELGLDANGRVFFTMKLVKGETLGSVFEKVKDGVEGWNTTRALGTVQRVCEAMAFAHEKQVIHRDLKPANIMVGRHGEVYVMDWGLARVIGREDRRDIRVRPDSTASFVRTDRREVAADTPDSPVVTMDGDIVGTPSYMPPEQAEGNLEAIGPHSDVYAVGAILWHLLAGHPPYVEPGEPATGRVILRRVQVGPPPAIDKVAPNAPAELLAIVEKAMARKTAARYETMTALADDLRAYLERRVVKAYATGPFAELKKWVERNPGLTTAAAALVLVLATATGIVVKKNDDLSRANVEITTQKAAVDAKHTEVTTQKQVAEARKAEFDQLAGVVLLDEALKKESNLYPAWPEKIAAMEEWLAQDGARLRILRPEIDATTTRLRRDALPPTPEEQNDAATAAAARAELEQVRAAIANHDRLSVERQNAPQVPLLAWRSRADPKDEGLAAGWHLPAFDAARWQEFATPKGHWEQIGVDSDLDGILWYRIEFELPVHWHFKPTRAVFESSGDSGQVWLNGRLIAEFGDSAIRTGNQENRTIAEFESNLVPGRNTLATRVVSQSTEGGIFLPAFVTTCSPAAVSDVRPDARIRALYSRVAELEPVAGGTRRWRLRSEAEQFLHDALAELLSKLEAFESSTVPDVERRLAWAKRIAALTLHHTNARVTWDEARAAIAKADGVTASARYRNSPLDLQPQMGLVPIGMNPATKLWEFYELRSACDVAAGQDPESVEIPVHREDGSIEVRDGTGIVFVLIPEGTFTQGAAQANPNASTFDPDARGDEAPREATLAPYFLARHEMTKGQWFRLTNGDEPGFYKRGLTYESYPTAIGWAHPVEQVDWTDSDSVLRRHGLALPTEAEWEYGARAGTRTPWWTGSEASSLSGAANVLDRRAEARHPDWGPQAGDFDDGFVAIAPVGSFLANPFGLFDLHGNVCEWCRDAYVSRYWVLGPTDRLLTSIGASQSDRVHRGGSFDATASEARSAARKRHAPSNRDYDVGLRPARNLMTAGD